MNSSNVGALLAAACWLGAALPASAQTIYTDRAAFIAATTNHVITGFENATLDGSGSAFYGYNYTGTDFSIANNQFIFVVSSSNSSYNYNSGNVLTLQDGQGTISIGAGVSAFGFDYGKGSQGGGSLDIFINNVAYTQLGRPNLSFFGIVGTPGLGPVSININGGIGVIDNVTVASARAVTPTLPGAVPEPASWAMMIAGFAAVGGTLRRRARKAVRFA